jgi:hypothetical protein
MYRRASICLLITILLVVSEVGCNKDVKVFVHCNPSLPSGYACAVEHRGGDVRADVSWDLDIACRNGAHLTASVAQAVEPRGKASKFVSIGDLQNFDRCDQASSMTIENIKVVGVPGSGGSHQFPAMALIAIAIIIVVTSVWIYLMKRRRYKMERNKR